MREGSAMHSDRRLALALFFMRLGVFVVMFIWTIDKFMRPEHSAAVFKTFYFIGGLGNNVFYAIGVVELVIIIAFLVGYQKRWTYGAVLLLHGISTFASFRGYIMPFKDGNIMFFAAWPMLAAAFALYYLRDMDTFLVVEKKRRSERRGERRGGGMAAPHPAT